MAGYQMVGGSVGVSMKDSRWLQLEVCREFQRSKCTRNDNECKFAHPQAHVDIQNGKVTACFDSIKGRCNREKPPCKYFHPPSHLKEQLIVNGRNHLAVKNALMQQLTPVAGGVPVNGTNPMVIAYPPATEMSANSPAAAAAAAAAAAQMYGISPGLAHAQYYSQAVAAAQAQALGAAGDSHHVLAAQMGLQQLQQQHQQQQKPRTDRIEGEQSGYEAPMYYGAYPGVSLAAYGNAYKRMATTDKTGGASYYPQLLIAQQSYQQQLAAVAAAHHHQQQQQQQQQQQVPFPGPPACVPRF